MTCRVPGTQQWYRPPEGTAFCSWFEGLFQGQRSRSLKAKGAGNLCPAHLRRCSESQVSRWPRECGGQSVRARKGCPRRLAPRPTDAARFIHKGLMTRGQGARREGELPGGGLAAWMGHRLPDPALHRGGARAPETPRALKAKVTPPSLDCDFFSNE